MGSSLRIQRSGRYGMLTLELSSTELELQIRLVSQQARQARRVIALSFLRQIQPWLRPYLKCRMRLGHASHGEIFNQRDQRRGVCEFLGDPKSVEAGQLGFEIRMKRLKLGLTQAELAAQAGIQRTHLSEIERGLHFPSSKTRIGLEKYLEVHDEPAS